MNGAPPGFVESRGLRTSAGFVEIRESDFSEGAGFVGSFISMIRLISPNPAHPFPGLDERAVRIKLALTQ